MNLPNRGVATGASVGFAIVSYFVYYLAALVDALEPFRQLSVFYHYHGTEVLEDGIHLPGLAVLLLLFAVLTYFAWRGFERRDIGVGGELKLPQFLRRQAA
jgi:hypothetical protein